MGILSTLWGSNDPIHTDFYKSIDNSLKLSVESSDLPTQTKESRNTSPSQLANSSSLPFESKDSPSTKSNSASLAEIAASIASASHSNPNSALFSNSHSSPNVPSITDSQKSNASSTTRYSIQSQKALEKKPGKGSFLSNALMSTTHGVVINDTLKDVTEDTGKKLSVASKKLESYAAVAYKRVKSSTTVLSFRLAFVDFLETFLRVIFTIITKIVFLARDIIVNTMSAVYSACLIPLDFILILTHSIFLHLSYRILDKKRTELTDTESSSVLKTDVGANSEENLSNLENEVLHAKAAARKLRSAEQQKKELANLAETRKLFWSGKPVSIRASFMDRFQDDNKLETGITEKADPSDKIEDAHFYTFPINQEYTSATETIPSVPTIYPSTISFTGTSESKRDSITQLPLSIKSNVLNNRTHSLSSKNRQSSRMSDTPTYRVGGNKNMVGKITEVNTSGENNFQKIPSLDLVHIPSHYGNRVLKSTQTAPLATVAGLDKSIPFINRIAYLYLLYIALFLLTIYIYLFSFKSWYCIISFEASSKRINR